MPPVEYRDPQQQVVQPPVGASQPKYQCPKCGYAIALWATSCDKCGTPLNWRNQAQTLSPPSFQKNLVDEQKGRIGFWEWGINNLGLVFVLLLLASGLWWLIVENFGSLSFNWEDLLVYLGIALVVYGIVRAIGSSLNKKFNKSVQAFLDNTKTTLFDDKGLLQIFGFLLIVLLPFLLYLLALAVYSAVTLAVYGLIGLSYLSRVPVILLIGIAIIGIGTVIGILIGLYRLFFPPRRSTLGIEVKTYEQNRLWQVTDEISKRIKAKPINRIIITPSSGIGVYLEGNVFSTIFGGGQRTLELGLPSLHNINVIEFKAILAHEYGHFSNRDTQWSAFTYAMGTSLLSSLRSVPGPPTDGTEGGGILRFIISINPGYWILFVYVDLYSRITNGFSRIREVMADIRAMDLFGGKALSDGLLKIVLNDSILNNIVKENMSHFARTGEVIKNYSKAMEFACNNLEQSYIETFKATILAEDEKQTVHDSHPSLRTRIGYLSRFNPVAEASAYSVASLFDDWDKINEETSQLFNCKLAFVLELLGEAANSNEELK